MTCPNYKRTYMKKISLLLAIVAFSSMATAEYPDRPIRLVVPFPPGAASDVIARAIASAAGPAIGQAIIVDNKAGADGILSAAEVARAKPDGLTLLFGTNSALSASPALKKTLPYDPVKSFVPVTGIGRYTFFLYVSEATQAKTLPELVALAKREPGKLNFATGNTTALVSSLQLNATTGVEMQHVAYRGEPAAITDLVGNQVQVMFGTPALGMPHLAAGKLRVLATTSAIRSPLMPEVPTLKEAGLPNFSITSWAGLFAPAGTPPEITAKVAAAFNAALKEKAVVEQLNKQGFVTQPGTGNDLGRLVAEQLTRYRETIRAAGIQPE